MRFSVKCVLGLQLGDARQRDDGRHLQRGGHEAHRRQVQAGKGADLHEHREVSNKGFLMKRRILTVLQRYKSVDTTLFRRAIKHYIHCLFGIRHDDYDYALVNELLPR